MCKYFFKMLTMMTVVLLLSGGCTATSDDDAKTNSVSKIDPVSKMDDSAEIVDTAKIVECTVVPLNKPIACTMQYDPVCGCDDKTYSNACAARGAGVPSSTPGACEKDPID